MSAFSQNAVTISLTAPATQTSFTTNQNAVTLRGTANSAAGIQRVTWNALTTQREGAASGTGNWAVDNIWLLPGTNEVTITAYDFAGYTTTKTFYITYRVENVPPKIVVTSPTAGQIVPVGSKPIISWYVTGTVPAKWTVTHTTPDVQIMLYRNGSHVANLTGFEIGVTSVSNYAFNYPAGDGYQIRVASHEGSGLPGSYEGFSAPFTIGPTGTPIISSFGAGGPNVELGSSTTVKLGEVVSLRWKISGGAANQLTISNGVGDVTGRDGKLIPTTQVGQFTYTLMAANSYGSAAKSVTVNVQPNAQYNQPEVLYNGITLDSAWPPKPAGYPDTTQLPPYLVNPPSLIPINVGRQLFVDDFLIESSTLTRQFHPATMYAGNPVLKPSSSVEKSGLGPMAMPYSNGVFYDPNDKLYKMWYMCGYRVNICYATSNDGLAWTKPNLDIVPGTNIIYKDTNLVDSYTNWIDFDEPIAARRFKMLRVVFNTSDQFEYHLHYSSDGIHWGPAVVINKSLTNDAGSYFFNPFRKKWGLTLKDLEPGPIRLRRYTEQADLSFALQSVVKSNPSAAETLFANTSKFIKADALDTARPEDPSFTPNLYAFQAAAYESLMLGQIAILRADGDTVRPKLNEVYFGFSRDGFYWHRPNRQAMFGVGNKIGQWNWGNVQPIAGGPLVVGDQLYFYFSGRAGTLPGTNDYADSNGGAGLATMRRDGFASLNAVGNEGSVTTRKVTFDGRYLFVNAEISSGGSLCAEILNESNQVIAPFTKANCQAFTGNKTKQLLGWAGGNDLGSLIGKVVKFRFYLRNGKLFSFWVSPTTEGASRGYVGAGGPGFTTSRDIGGNASLNPTATLSPATQTIGLGQAATLNYSVSNATSVTLTPAIAGCNIALVNGAANGTCKPVGNTTGTFNFVLTAFGNGATESDTATVIVQNNAAPVLTLVNPTQTLLPTGTTQIKLELTTNVNATCRFASGADAAFSAMTPFTQTGALSHSISVNTANGQTYSYYVRCADAANNISNPLAVTFAVATNNNNKALQFDGKSGVVTVTSNAAAPLTKQWTIETWVKTSAQPNLYQFILGNSTSNDIRITPGPNARAMVSINTGAITNFIGSKIINDGKWHHLVAVRNNDKLYLYVDGQADIDSETSQTAKTVGNAAGDNELSLKAIGNRGLNAGAEWFEGQIDEVRLHNRAFAASEIVTRYNNGKGQPAANESNLALGFSFNETAGAALDFSSSGSRGTLNGGVLRVNSNSTLTNVSAASFTPSAASESIVAGFGANLTTATEISKTLPLPTKLGGVSVTVRDSQGVPRLAPLFFVSPTQINYQIPAGTAEGMATVSLVSADNTVFTGSFIAGPIAPGIFTANANGAGIPAAVALRVKSNGATSYESVARFDTTSNKFVAQPIDLGPTGEQVFLILYGTGFRGRSALSKVTAKFADISTGVQFAGASPGFVGLDQVNVQVPRSLIGRGNIVLTLTVDGKNSNTVTINLR